MKPLNVLFDHQVFSVQEYGGVSRIFYQLIKHLCDKEDLRLLLFQGWHINRFPLAELRDRLAFYRGREVGYFPHVSLLLKAFNRLGFKAFSRGKSMDVYHPTSYSPIVSQWRKSPVVLTVNDMIPELFPHHFRDIKTRLQVKKKCIRRADIIITISRNTRSDLVNYYPAAAGKVRVIYPGAPSSPGDDEDLRPFPHARPYILYVGTRKQGYKNFYGFYSGFAASPKLVEQFDIICFGGGDFKKKELRLLAGTGSPVRIFRPTGDERLLPALYRGAAAMVYPSLYEGFGLPPLEAMTYGCPVIAAQTSAIPEVLGDAAAYFNPREPQSITKTIDKVLFDKQLKEEMVKKGKQQVKLYSWKKMAEETHRIYRELTG
jgi:glycosyltransferase involved in cell wall biosynthesis